MNPIHLAAICIDEKKIQYILQKNTNITLLMLILVYYTPLCSDKNNKVTLPAIFGPVIAPNSCSGGKSPYVLNWNDCMLRNANFGTKARFDQINLKLGLKYQRKTRFLLHYSHIVTEN